MWLDLRATEQPRKGMLALSFVSRGQSRARSVDGPTASFGSSGVSRCPAPALGTPGSAARPPGLGPPAQHKEIRSVSTRPRW